MKILSFECSAKAASVAICDGDKLLCEFYSNVGLTHSQTLLPMTEAALKATNLTIDDIDGLAISAGPGSFTGLRIGISAVKGLAIAKNKPCVGVSTLHALALSQKCTGKNVVAVMDARCSQCYSAVFGWENENFLQIFPDEALSMEELCGRIKEEHEKSGKEFVVVGDGAELFMKTQGKGLDFLTLADSNTRFAAARYVAEAALPRFLSGNTQTGDRLEATYLRLPQAERELRKKQNQQ